MGEKITIARGLAEIKLLDSRITNEINNAIFVTNITGKKSITNHNLTKDDYDRIFLMGKDKNGRRIIEKYVF